MALGDAIYFLYLYIWILRAGSSEDGPARWFSFTPLNEKTKNGILLPELAVAYYDGLINKLLSRPARPW